MANERRALDVCTTPPLTPTANGKFENGNGGADGRDGSVAYTLKPATRAYASTARLNLQHYLWKDQTGFLLHPNIRLDWSRTDLKIADVGTGTGIWLLDLARTLPPTAQLDGFDIDISDCPPEPWLPRNVTMRQLDALGEMPPELIGVYDVVHLRLFQVVVKDNDPEPLLRNVVSMLKPGGHLQWSEYDPSTHHTLKASPQHPSPSLDAIPPFVQSFQRLDPRIGTQPWIPQLPATFAAHAALTDVEYSRHGTREAYLGYQLDVFLLTYEELAGKVLDGVGGGERLRGLVEGGREEGRRGVGWGGERLVVVGRKKGGQGRDGKGGEAGVGVEAGGNGDGSGEKSSEPPGLVEQMGMGMGREKRRSGRERWVRVWKRLSSSSS